jgi:hypothetical protein
MSVKPSTALYFTSVVAIERGLAVLGGHLFLEEAEPTVTRFMLCFGKKWQHLYDMDEVSYAASRKPGSASSPRGPLCLLGRQGLYQETESGSPPSQAQISTEGAGYLLYLKYVGKHLYACGGQRQVHRQVGQKWQRRDQGVFVPISDEAYCSFEAIDGFSEQDIYAVGWPSDIWHFDGTDWRQLDCPTNYPLSSVLCSRTGDVYIGGSNGLLFKGDRDRGWADLSDSGVTTEVLEDMTEFQGRIYITATDQLLWTDGGPLQDVSVPIPGDKAYYAIDSIEDELWCVGDESVLQFDGKDWQQFVCPENI